MRDRWPGAAVVCIASGPSLTPEDCETVRAWRERGPQRFVVVVNTTFLAAPWADVLYAGDSPWWRHYESMCVSGQWQRFAGERWSASTVAKRESGTQWVRSRTGDGLSTGLIHRGGNSGYQALQLAVYFGAKRIVLLGYDMQRTAEQSHWHGDHPAPLCNGWGQSIWAKSFNKLAPQLRAAGVEVTNATRSTAISAFERQELPAALSENDLCINI